MNARNAHRGFTLIELLVVLTIIGLLTALLLPVFANARERGRLSACASNLQQLGKACAIYASDSDGYLPPYPSRLTCLYDSATNVHDIPAVPDAALVASLEPYVRSRALWRCPSDNNIFGANAGWSSCTGGLNSLIGLSRFTSYIYFGFDPTEHGIAPERIDRSIGDLGPSVLHLLQDDAACANNFHSPGLGYDAYNHGGEWNRVYLDGHAKSFTYDCTDPGRPVEQ